MKKTKSLYNLNAIKEIAEEKQKWQESSRLAGSSNDKEYQTLSGLNLKAIYTPEDISEMDYAKDLGFPGEAPFVRGVHPTMYRGRKWTMRQLAGFGPPEETNKRYRFLLKEGATGINGVFDYPTLRGYDSTDAIARADAGRGGVAIDTLDDMRILFDQIPIEKISTSLVTSQPICNITIQSMYFANALNRGLKLKELRGTSQNDFMMETVVTASPEVLTPEMSFKLSCDAIEFCTNHVPNWNPISFSGYNYRESGCSATQEIAFVIANAIACTEELTKRGLDVDSFAPRLSFFLSAHNDFFEEIAKYRAARRVWQRIMKDRLGSKNPRSQAFRFHVQTAGVALTAQQPLNNITRSAYHGLAAVLGGAQSVHIDGYDEALCTPTELSALTALRTNQILQMETRTTNTIDPLGGSYFIESLTFELEKQIMAQLEEIDRKGGIITVTRTGWIHREIADSAFKYQEAVESGDMPIVGLNCFQQEDEELPLEFFEVPETLSVQEQKLEKIKNERSASAVNEALDDVSRCCDEGGNMMEVMLKAVTSYATEGELSQTIRKRRGTWQMPLF